MLKPSLRGTLVLLALAVAMVGQPLLAPSFATAAPAGLGAQATQSPDAQATKGPVGWDVYRDLGRLAGLTTGVQTQQFSSFDRGGANADFSNTLAHAADGYVLAEHQGPGEVDAIWSTRDQGDVRATGRIRVTLDGALVLNAPLQDVVDGKLGAPFVFPVVGNARQSSGGVYINAPMPFRRSMRITTDTDPVYYNVTTRTFADAEGVSTFDPTDQALDVIAQFAAAGTRDPKPAQPNATTTQQAVALNPGQTVQLGALSGPGAISALRLRVPQLLVPTPSYFTDDGRAFGGDGAAHSEFTLAIDPHNSGVRLTRRLNPEIANQQADIYVDGVKVAAWAPLPAPRDRIWQDQTVDLPPAATAGKSHIVVRNVFVSSNNDFNEYAYWADSLVDADLVRTDTVDVGPQHTQNEAAHGYSIVEQTYAGTRVSYYPLTAEEQRAVLATSDVLQGARLRITFDGQRTVDAPLGEFFGSGRQLRPVNSLMYGIDPATQTLSAWWSMPYGRSADVELYNGSTRTINSVESAITSAGDATVAEQLGPTGNLGHFRTTSNRAASTPGQDYVFLNAAGWGKFVGVTHTMIGSATRNYLEGDERVYVDGSRSPQIQGTGTEDFYQGGWYFNRATFSAPTHGNPTHEAARPGCPSDCTGAYRQMLADAVPFHSAITFGIEHGPVDDEPTTNSSTAYWYGRAATVQRTTDSIDVGDVGSEQAHHYSSADPGAVTTLTATYEGNDGVPTLVTDTVRATTSEVSFTVQTTADNTGVSLRRTSDQKRVGQSAQVFVDGQDIGTWRQPLANPFHRWLDDSFDLPPSLTKGKAQVTVRLVPTAGAAPFSAARYQVLTTVAPFLDRQPPAQISGLRAHSSARNVINLAWNPGVDDVGVDHYKIYGSTDPAFSNSPGTLLGTARVNTFTHSGLGLWQTWHYRVVAVDAADNTGPRSTEASATAGIIPSFATSTLLYPAPDPAVGAATALLASVTPNLVLGTVTFRDGDRPIAGCTDRPVILGLATCVTTFTTAGPHSVTAAYSGDGLHTRSAGFTAVNVTPDGDIFKFALGLLIQYLHNEHLFGL